MLGFGTVFLLPGFFVLTTRMTYILHLTGLRHFTATPLLKGTTITGDLFDCQVGCFLDQISAKLVGPKGSQPSEAKLGDQRGGVSFGDIKGESMGNFSEANFFFSQNPCANM